jgi:gluconolactonase
MRDTRTQIILDDVELVASGLVFPEGPVVLPDGSVLIVEMRRGTLSRVDAGAVEVVAECTGCPNGAALGPDGAVYVCNNGGYGDDYQGGSIQRVDLDTGDVATIHTSCDGHPLCGPNDLAFDDDGMFWFTDTGKFRARDRDRGGIYYASPDGSMIREAIYPVDAPNGVGISPDGSALYYSETLTGRVYRRTIVGPGEVQPAREHDPDALICGLPGMQMFDSLAVDAEGNVCVATLFTSAVTVVEPSGAWVRQLVLPEEFTDPMVTNLCFAGDGTAYITLSETGRLVRCRWPEAELGGSP